MLFPTICLSVWNLNKGLKTIIAWHNNFVRNWPKIKKESVIPRIDGILRDLEKLRTMAKRSKEPSAFGLRVE